MDPGWPSNPPLQVTLIFNSSFSKKVFLKAILSLQVICPLCRVVQPLKDGANALLQHLAAEHAVRSNFNLLFTIAMLQPKHVGGKLPGGQPASKSKKTISPTFSVGDQNPTPLRASIAKSHLNSMMDEARRRVDEKPNNWIPSKMDDSSSSLMKDNWNKEGGRSVLDEDKEDKEGGTSVLDDIIAARLEGGLAMARKDPVVDPLL